MAARIRKSQIKNAKSRISSDSKSVKQMNQEYKELQAIKKHANSKNGSRLAKSRVSTAIRNHQINSLKNKIKRTNASIKEDHQIVKELNKYEANAQKRAQNISRTKAAMQKAKAVKKAANKQYSKDFNKSTTLYGAWGPGNKARHKRTYNSAIAANKADAAYKRAKKAYKNAKK